MKDVVVNEAPVGLQSHGPTKPQRESSPVSRTMSNVHNDNEHSVDRSNRKIAPVFVYPALRVMYSTATPCRVSIVTLDGKEATSGISSTPIKL